MNLGIVVTVRVKSSRIHEKALQYVDFKRRAIEVLLDNVVNDEYPVVMAIPESKENDILEQIAFEKGVVVYRGEDDSPLHRLLAAAKDNDFEYVVRVTADDILIDSLLMFNMIRFSLNGNLDYCYMRKCPEGVATEVIRVSALERVANENKDKSIEFISYYLKNRFKTREYYPPFEYQFPYRLVMDYEEDLTLLRILFCCLSNPGTLDIINFLKKHKYLLRINHLPEVTVYTCNYNTADYIIDCMESVLNQDFDDFEYIVLDDGSTDNSMDVIMEYYSKLSPVQQKRVKVIRNEENSGLVYSSNKCTVLGRGRFIVRVDSDDTIHPNFISETVTQARLDESDGVLTGYNETKSALTATAEILENMWHPACALLSRWCVNELKYKDGLTPGFEEGKEFYNRWRKVYKTSFIPKPLWNYRRREGQKTQDPSHPKNEAI